MTQSWVLEKTHQYDSDPPKTEDMISNIGHTDGSGEPCGIASNVGTLYHINYTKQMNGGCIVGLFLAMRYRKYNGSVGL